jgi:hypothetical protein
VLPPRVQRRMGELCEIGNGLNPLAVRSATARALNRAGLYVCGDLGVAFEWVAASEGVSLGPGTPASLRALCQENERLGDLVRWATSFEYAEARWRSGRPPASR